MPYSEQEKKAFAARCKQNFHDFNNRIKDLEQRADQEQSPGKLLADIIAIKKELTKKTGPRQFKVELFWNKDKPTRDRFLARLDNLLGRINNRNKKKLKETLAGLESRLETGRVSFNELKNLEIPFNAVPYKDNEKKKLKSRIDSIWATWKEGQNSEGINTEIDALEQLQREAAQQIQQLAAQQLLVSTFEPVFKEMLSIHRALKKVQQQARQIRQTLNQQPLNKPVKDRYHNRITKVVKGVQKCWNHENLKKITNWIEEVTASNFQHFNRLLEEIEEQVESNLNRQQIATLQKQIKNIAEGVKAKDSYGNYLHPLKFAARQEWFDRSWTLKQHLSALWEGSAPVISPQYTQLHREIEQAVLRLREARAVDTMYKIIEEAKQFHGKRKGLLKRKQLSAPENGKLARQINSLYEDAYEAVHIARPKQFSLDWLQEAFEKNRQTGWVVFVDEVPPIR